MIMIEDIPMKELEIGDKLKRKAGGRERIDIVFEVKFIGKSKIVLEIVSCDEKQNIECGNPVGREVVEDCESISNYILYKEMK